MLGAPERLDFAETYRSHVRFVWRALVHLGVAAADVEDVCQEVFVVVNRKLNEFAGESTVQTWLYGIAYRCASQYRRRAHVRREVPTDREDTRAVSAAQLGSVERTEARALLAQILDELPEPNRAVFVFYEIEELTMAQVATIVGCPLQTAYSRLHAARRHVERAAARLVKRNPNSGGAR
jgi:RNA polymerase sigma-70 factor (ECF subfamily)